jgi:thioester reductase-like protein
MSHAGETLLVTGFPGFHARKLCAYLLEQEPEARLIVLRRAVDAERSAELLSQLSEQNRARVTLLEGDPAALDFGLSGREYRALTASIQRVYHFASVLEARRKKTELASYNVACAREVLAFAAAGQALRGVVLLSTVAVCGTRTGIIREDELAQGQTFQSRLEESLATVELMFARHPNLPVVVLRPSQIVGDSQTGELESPGFPYPWLVFIDRGPSELIVPVPHRPDAPVQIVPIDFVLRAAHFLGARQSAYGQRYHLVDPQPPTLKEFLHMAAQASGKRLAENFSAGAFTRGLVANQGLRLLAQGARGLFDLFAPAPQFDTTNAARALAEGNVQCPPVASYLSSLFERARAGFAAHEVDPLDLAQADEDA